ncbi:hypothetical protein C0993_010335 [Termitomyces sp. T159_Od127]|nr:hypothetical protein C0993_010335 [Termitomyces sp. T159_Od127]
MLGEYMFKKELGKLWGIVGGVAEYEDGLFGEVADDDKDGWLTDGEWLEKAVEAVMGHLGLKARLTSLDILNDVLLHTWPKVSSGDELKGLTNPGMSVELVVVVLAEDVQADLLVVQGIDLSISDKELVVGGEGERAIVVGIVCRSVPGVVLSEEGAPRSVVNLV